MLNRKNSSNQSNVTKDEDWEYFHQVLLYVILQLFSHESALNHGQHANSTRFCGRISEGQYPALADS